MKFIPSVALVAAMLLSLAACHGSSPTSSGLPPTSDMSQGASQAVQAPDVSPDSNPITSTCPVKIKLAVLAVLDCKFREKGYHGVFNIHTNRLGPVATVLPSSGTAATTFVIAAVVVGTGRFTVTDKHGNRKTFRVTVTLL
jgi:hypothetical protein